eukprot:COSAG01_NODE_36847_length_512_cov_0.585956_2_plen_93_part_00
MTNLTMPHQRGIAIHNAGVFNTGLLVGGVTFEYGQASAEVIARARGWGDLAAEHGLSLPGLALAFAALVRCPFLVVDLTGNWLRGVASWLLF